ncbi:hypothetical protein OsJ_10354 [Oryza sativa Japonica Group]|uniref:DDE Tnp4 domain-containing protein n=1 Tax=Oryza sativa subsp. japonica TaxID=39947 RepID=B9F7C3_ORYSJ|nr:hypothetical protein OsJ_10354 [Oryza sativa Japonica Group]
MVRIMRNIQTTMDINCDIANKVMQGEFRFNSIKEMGMYGSDDVDEEEDETIIVASRQLDMMRKFGPVLTSFGKFYLVDSGYPNQLGYLSPYKGTKYHLPEFREGPRPSGKKEVFNHLHSSLRNVIERSFGVLKMKWRILLDLPSYPMLKQTKIIHACMALHNFIRDSKLSDEEFDLCDNDENYMPMPSSQGNASHMGDEDGDANAFRDSIADALFAKR